MPVPVIHALAFFLGLEQRFHCERSAPDIMINVLIHHEVADYTAWKAAFDSAFDLRRKHGELSCRIFRSAGNPNGVTLFFEWESLEKARAFIASEELKAKMASAGVKVRPESNSSLRCTAYGAALLTERAGLTPVSTNDRQTSDSAHRVGTSMIALQ